MPTARVRSELITAVANGVRDFVGSRGTVTVNEESGAYFVAVVPRNPRASGIWIVADEWIDIQIGDSIARLELQYAAVDVGILTSLVRAVVDGQGFEVRALGRVAVTVDVGGGRTLSTEANVIPFVPLPGWRRWGKKTPMVGY